VLETIFYPSLTTLFDLVSYHLHSFAFVNVRALCSALPSWLDNRQVIHRKKHAATALLPADKLSSFSFQGNAFQPQQHQYYPQAPQQFFQAPPVQAAPKRAPRARQALLIVDPETKEAIELPPKPEVASSASVPVAAAPPAAQAPAAKPIVAQVATPVPIKEPTAAAQTKQQRSKALSIRTPDNSQPASGEPSPVKTRGPGLPEVAEMKQMVAAVQIDAAVPAAESAQSTAEPAGAAMDIEDEDDVFDEDDEPEDDIEDSTEAVRVPYADGFWSPDTPDARKAYSLAFLRQFRDLCRLRLDTDKLTSQQSKIHAELFGPGEPTGQVARQIGGGGQRANRSKRGSKSAGVAGLNFVPSGPGRAKAKQVINIPARPVMRERGENAFVPNVAKGKSKAGPTTEEEKVQATLLKAQSILNKMTMEKFDKLSDELIRLGEQLSEEALRQFVERVFQKVRVHMPFGCQ
jgi:translation initiation factor 4G